MFPLTSKYSYASSDKDLSIVKAKLIQLDLKGKLKLPNTNFSPSLLKKKKQKLKVKVIDKPVDKDAKEIKFNFQQYEEGQQKYKETLLLELKSDTPDIKDKEAPYPSKFSKMMRKQELISDGE